LGDCNGLPVLVGHWFHTSHLTLKERRMNEDTIKGNWKQFKGKVQEQWGKLTNDDLDVVDGKREQLVGRIQEREGIAQDAAEKQVKDWETKNNYRW
jgi:uncharacterized protein YjbJ (UPF0337 family)